MKTLDYIKWCVSHKSEARTGLCWTAVPITSHPAPAVTLISWHAIQAVSHLPCHIPVTGGFPSHKVSNAGLWCFYVSLNILFYKQWSCWWFETQWRPCDITVLCDTTTLIVLNTMHFRYLAAIFSIEISKDALELTRMNELWGVFYNVSREFYFHCCRILSISLYVGPQYIEPVQKDKSMA